MNSIWTETVKLPDFPHLAGDVKTDVLIIGGGIAGLLCAYMLEQSGIDYILVEADRICNGVTKNTTAKITAQHGLIFDRLIREFGTEKAAMYLRANEEALAEYRRLAQKIDCDFENSDSYVYAVRNAEGLEKEMCALDKIGFRAEYVEKLPLPFSTFEAVKFPSQAQFNPLKFLKAIVQGLHIYEHTKVKEMGVHKAITERGTITAENIIVATHYPFINKHGAYFLKIYQSRSYVLALDTGDYDMRTENRKPENKNLDGMYADENDKGLSFRTYDKYLLLGGGSHRTGKKGGNWAELADFANEYYPHAKEVSRWATQDCMTLDMVPYIGRYARHTDGLYVATGFNKWGMTSSMAAAMLLRDMILGRSNEYAPVFSQERTIFRKQLAINMAESTMNLLTFSQKRCPHMGCALKWNPVERSWDCPCHGSRFTREGELIDNPATDDLE